MKPPAFDYCRPDDLEEVLELLARHGEEASLLAGGQSLVAMLNLRLTRPRVLIDISRLEPLRRLERRGGALEVGAGVTQAALAESLRDSEDSPLLKLALPWVGHYQTRSRGTICGSLAHADPSAELPLCLAALGGSLRLGSARGERELSAEDFQLGPLTTARAPDEMILAARFPLPRPGQGVAFREIARRHGDFAIVALAAIAEGEEIRLAVAGVADRPAVRGWHHEEATLEEALNAFAWDLEGYDDMHASARYRRDLVRRLGRSVIEEARACRS
ncbi:MAG: FAD binding domain-containing protein [Tistlia sp.]|uniref:xanthine dehydrogenase family protein subunit M n=1 Tax=Tistlia sp. TaxID=3057121 RepID=UPI0034A24465